MANKIGALRYWCTKVIPLVYDDSLSYYEVLCKVTEKLNEVIEVANAGGWTQEEIEQFVKDSVDEYLAAIDLPSAADIAQLQTDVDDAQEDIAALADGKMNKLPQNQTDGAVVVVDGTGVASGEVTITELQESISAASTAAASAASTAGTAVNTANAANTTATSALTAAQNAQNAATSLDANKANKVSGYTGSGKILVTGSNDKTPVESDKGVGDFVEKIAGATDVQYAYTNTSGTDGSIQVTALAVANTLAKRGAGGRLCVGTPSRSDDAATKLYVDNAVAGSGGGIPIVNLNGSTLDGATIPSLITYFNGNGIVCIKGASDALSQIIVGYPTADAYAFSAFSSTGTLIDYAVAVNGTVTAV